jgi:hypothetical protein
MEAGGGGGGGGGGAAARAPPPPADHCLMWHATVLQSEAVDHGHCGRRRQRRQRRRQRVQVAAVQAALVDAERRAQHDGDAEGAGNDLREQPFATFGCVLFGVVEIGQRLVVWRAPGRVVEADGGRHQRAGQSSTARLVGSGHDRRTTGRLRPVGVEDEQFVHAVTRPLLVPAGALAPTGCGGGSAASI